jgi:hypothetical protein
MLRSAQSLLKGQNPAALNVSSSWQVLDECSLSNKWMKKRLLASVAMQHLCYSLSCIALIATANN